MNNGQTRESKHRIVLLEDEEPETFVAFCEYAYTGDYTVPISLGSCSDGVSVSVSVPPPVPSPPPRSVVSLGPSFGPAGGPGSERRVPESTTNGDKAVSVDDRDEPAFDVDAKDGFEEIRGDGDVTPVQGQLKSESTPTVTPGDVDQRSIPAGPAAGVDDDSWSFNAGISAPKPEKKGRRGKKFKKKRHIQAQSAEDLTPNLASPWTPPPEKQVEGVGTPRPTEEPVGTAASTVIIENWEQAVASTTADDDGEVQNAKIKPTIDTSFTRQQQQQQQIPASQGVSLWDEFVRLDYIDGRPSYVSSPAGPSPRPLSTHSTIRSTTKADDTDIPYLAFHAKVYVFATRYLIPALAQLCLRKLHRDLVHLSFPGPRSNYDNEDEIAFTTAKARMVLDLLHYTYTRTSRLEPVSPASSTTTATELRDNELRKLVVHYAACKVRDLAEYCPPLGSAVAAPSVRAVDGGTSDSKGLQGLLDSTTELASDLVYRMM